MKMLDRSIYNSLLPGSRFHFFFFRCNSWVSDCCCCCSSITPTLSPALRLPLWFHLLQSLLLLLLPPVVPSLFTNAMVEHSSSWAISVSLPFCVAVDVARYSFSNLLLYTWWGYSHDEWRWCILLPCKMFSTLIAWERFLTCVSYDMSS